MSKPEICIAVPFFNEERFLAQTLQSLAKQSYTSFKVVMLDNASTDNSTRIAKDFALFDLRFNYHRSSTNIGNLRNFLWGFEFSQEPFFMWLGAHDVISENYLAVLIQELKLDDKLSFSYGRHNFISEESVISPDFPQHATFPASDNPHNRFIYSIGALVVDSSPLHSVFRSDAIRGVGKYLILSKFSWDHAILSFASFSGNSRFVESATYTRRFFQKRESTNFTRTMGTNGKTPKRSMLNLIFVHCMVWLDKSKFSLWSMLQIPRIVKISCKNFKIKFWRNVGHILLTGFKNYRYSLSSNRFK